ncbi:hypothetical protein JDS87_29675 [Bacillus cereus]|nr:hypothetical protein [Bacillus cereus]MBJ8055937.1 hypothetical protein [Bacillus cereus]
MEDTIDLADLDASVEICPQGLENTSDIVISLYIPLKELVEEILSVVN